MPTERARFNIARDFGKRRAAIRACEFQPLIIGWIVAGREIDGAVRFAPQYFVGDHRSGRRAVAQQDMNSVLAENCAGGACEFLAEESSVVADEEGRVRFAAARMLGDGCSGQANICERKIFRDDRAPARSSEFDRCRHF